MPYTTADRRGPSTGHEVHDGALHRLDDSAVVAHVNAQVSAGESRFESFATFSSSTANVGGEQFAASSVRAAYYRERGRLAVASHSTQPDAT